MDLVIDTDGHAVLKDGQPVYKYDDGTEQPLDLKETVSGYDNRISNLEQEKDRHFETAKKKEETLQSYGKITPDIAKKHADTIRKLDGKELVDTQGLEAYQKQWTDEVSGTINEEWEAKEVTWDEIKAGMEVEIKDMDKIIFNLAVNNKLAAHPYFAGDDRKTVFRPADASKIYGDRFSVKRDGTSVKVQALDRDGKVLLSKKNHGVPAGFDEAVELIVQSDNDDVYDIFRGSNIHGPRITGNTSTGGPGAEEGAKPVDLIKSGLKKHQRATGVPQ